ncbi:MAG: hypothetical protein JJE53_02175 [Candidatus Pacebacteria bacterium]|nr:hypothetical protein [Candidatus Paceibacterota bacterium]
MGYEQQKSINNEELAEKSIAENPELKTAGVSPEVAIEPKKVESEKEKQGKIAHLLEKLGIVKSKEKLIEEAIDRLANNPELKRQMDELEKTDPEKAEKWKIALAKWKYPTYNEATKEFEEPKSGNLKETHW